MDAKAPLAKGVRDLLAAGATQCSCTAALERAQWLSR